MDTMGAAGANNDDAAALKEETTAVATSIKRRNRIIFCMCLFLLILSVAYTSTDLGEIHVETRVMATSKQHLGRQESQDKHCVIHIHGFHHSGTGFLRKTIYDSLGHDSASMHQHTRQSEDEGQHIQQVYPPFYKRTELYPMANFASLYYCPEMLSLVSQKTRVLLFEQWSRYWNMTSSFLIQKTPTFDVLFLEKMKTTETVHVIVMRQPFSWRTTVLATTQQKTSPGLFTLCTWLQVWAFVLGILSDENQVKSFAVVNYEALVEINREETAHQLSTLIQDDCEMHLAKTEPTRRLELRVGNSSQYLAPSDGTLRNWNFCESNPVCHELMGKLTPVIATFGYSWDQDDYYENANVDSKLLYSSNQRPPREISEKMNALANEYCTRR